MGVTERGTGSFFGIALLLTCTQQQRPSTQEMGPIWSQWSSDKDGKPDGWFLFDL